jgi:hypothetical protein
MVRVRKQGPKAAISCWIRRPLDAYNLSRRGLAVMDSAARRTPRHADESADVGDGVVCRDEFTCG